MKTRALLLPMVLLLLTAMACKDDEPQNAPADATAEVSTPDGNVDAMPPDSSGPDVVQVDGLAEVSVTDQALDAPACPSGWNSMTSGTTTTLSGVWGSAMNDVFVVGDNGLILHYDGTGWTKMKSGTSVALHAVSGTGPKDVYAVGHANTVLHYDGASWTAQPGPGYNFTTIWDVWAVSPSLAYVATISGVGRYNGTNWSIEPGTPPNLRGIWATSSTAVAVGQNGTLLHYKGSTWTKVATGTTSYLRVVWGSSATNIHVGGFSGAALHYDGTKWTTSNLPKSVGFRDMWGTGATDVWGACGNMGLYHYDGFAWTQKVKLLMTTTHGFWSPGVGNGFAVGDNGAIDRQCP